MCCARFVWVSVWVVYVCVCMCQLTLGDHKRSVRECGGESIAPCVSNSPERYVQREQNAAKQSTEREIESRFK
jgi:hypothetical protein